MIITQHLNDNNLIFIVLFIFIHQHVLFQLMSLYIIKSGLAKVADTLSLGLRFATVTLFMHKKFGHIAEAFFTLETFEHRGVIRVIVLSFFFVVK